MRYKPAKILGLSSLILCTSLGTAQPDAPDRQLAGKRIVRAARRDVGIQERTWRNDNELFDYYRVLGGNPNRPSSKGWKDAYCAYGVYAWHRQAGLKPNVRSPGRAFAWSYHPSKIRLGSRADPDDIAKLKPGWVIGFVFDSNHVGIIEETYPFYCQTIEANTSLSNSVGTYQSKREGVIRKIRFYKSASWAADWRASPPSDTVGVGKLRAQWLATAKR